MLTATDEGQVNFRVKTSVIPSESGSFTTRHGTACPGHLNTHMPREVARTSRAMTVYSKVSVASAVDMSAAVRKAGSSARVTVSAYMLNV